MRHLASRRVSNCDTALTLLACSGVHGVETRFAFRQCVVVTRTKPSLIRSLADARAAAAVDAAACQGAHACR